MKNDSPFSHTDLRGESQFPRSWLWFPFLFLSLAAAAGTLIRLSVFFSLPAGLSYPNVIHAHSHVAFQGWVYLMILFLLVRMFLDEEDIRKGRFRLQFQLTVAVLIPMFFAFLFQGYALISIVLSTVFQFLNYLLIITFWIRLRHHPPSLSKLFIKFSLASFGISTMGPWALAVIMAKGLAGTDLYRSAVYFFLHFQYNGAFLFGLFAIIIPLGNIRFSIGRQVGWLYMISLFPSFFLSLLGMNLPVWLRMIAWAGGAFQFLFLGILVAAIRYHKGGSLLNGTPFLTRLFLNVCFISLLLKFLLMGGSTIGPLARWVYADRNIIVAYLHLVLLGVISSGLIGMVMKNEWLNPEDKMVKTSSFLFISGFFLNEGILAVSAFLRSEMLVQSGTALASLLLLAGALGFTLACRRSPRLPAG